MRWICADTQYCPEQFFCSHLDSYSHYLREAGETVNRLNMSEPRYSDTLFVTGADAAFILDKYDVAARPSWWPARIRIAQVAAICNPMPWDVRNADGSPAYDAIISSIPWMVEAAQEHGCRGVYMPLAFDTRARACGMGVKRERKCIFIGTRGPSHRKREEWLTALSDIVEVRPPCFGRAYFRELASAAVVLHVGAEWSRGVKNAMRLFEAAGMGCEVVTDGENPRHAALPGFEAHDATDARHLIKAAIEHHLDEDECQDWYSCLASHTYESRIPQLIELAHELMEAKHVR